MSDEPDRKLPVPASEKRDTPSVLGPTPRHTGGIIDTWVTGWRAKQKAAAHSQLAALNRAKADEVDAYGELAKSYERTARVVRSLDDLPDVLALDATKARVERETDYAEFDERRAERAHQADLAKLRRAREIEEANARLVEAKRGTFGAAEGLESQERLKQLNLEMWEKRAATEQLDAEKIWLLLRREVDGIKSPSKKTDDGSLEQLAEMRESLVQRAQEAAASGDASKAEKYERLAAELDDMVVAALRGQAQK